MNIFRIQHVNMFSVISYNVFFGPSDSDEKRFISIIDFLVKGNYDIIMLQEVTALFLDCARACLDSEEYIYDIDAIERIHENGYGSLILVKTRVCTKLIFFINTLPSMMGRALICAVVDGITFISTHLESTFKFQHMRTRQLKYLCSNFEQRRVVVGMDSNFSGELPLTQGFKDVWEGKRIHTWFGQRYSNTNRRYGYDRFVTNEKVIVAKDGVIDLPYSDHNPIVCTIYHKYDVDEKGYTLLTFKDPQTIRCDICENFVFGTHFQCKLCKRIFCTKGSCTKDFCFSTSVCLNCIKNM